MCVARALERGRPSEQRIVDDPWAALFLSNVSRSAMGVGGAALGNRVFPGPILHFVLARLAFGDDHLGRALDRGIDQVVLVGAGYDTRAWRFAPRLGTLFEVDHPATAGRKARLVEGQDLPSVDRRVVQADLAVADLSEVLRGAGFDPSHPTFFAWEGVTMYLDQAAIQATLAAIRGLSAPGSALVLDFWWPPSSGALAQALHRLGPAALAAFGEPLTFSATPESATALLEEAGFEVGDLATAEDLERRYVPDGRPLYPHVFLVQAEV